MKAILISIKPKWVAKILNGEKTIEIRKTMPKCDLPIDVYIYCTKEDSLGRIKELPKDRYFVDCVETPQDFAKMDSGYDGKGKVVAKFICRKVEEIKQWYQPADSNCYNDYDNWEYETESLGIEELEQKSCLTTIQMYEYLGNNFSGYTKVGCILYIDNLEIFDKPKELSEFKHLQRAKATDCFVCDVYQLTEMCIGNRCLLPKPLTKAPQSWCYVEE